jgi:hypothetical protein
LLYLMIIGDECKLLNSSMQRLPFSCHFIPLRSKYSPQIPVLKNSQFMLFP